MHSQLQPFSCPSMDDLLERRIDVLYSVDLSDGTTALKWCQGKVVEVIDDAKVTVEWDAAPDIEGCEESTTSEQALFPSKWNKDNKAGAWRLDVDVELQDDMDESDDEDEVNINVALAHI